MSHTRVTRGAAPILGLTLLVMAAVFAQAQTQGTEYTPKEGQPGKDVIWLPTAQRLVEKMLDLAKVTAKDYVIDLGSGDGRTVIAAAGRGARALGIEYNPDMVELAKRLAAKAGVGDKAQFIRADIFETDISQATVLTMFLLPDLNLKLRPQILNLKPGTRVVSNTFHMGEWPPDETTEVEGECSSYCTALLWIVPAKVEGRWKHPEGELTFTQSFQMVAGALTSPGNHVPLSNARLRGEHISFTVGNTQYTGQVLGNSMQGEFKAGKRTGTWSAVRID